MSDDSASDFSDAESMFEELVKAKPTKKAPAPKKAAAIKKAPAKPVSKKRPAPTSDDESSTVDSSSKKQKKAPAKSKAAKSKVEDSDDDNGVELDIEDEVNGELAPATKKSSSDKYQKLTQLEHILKRPDTYIGSIEQTEKQMWVFDSTTETMAWKTITMVPGLYKIFDEILVNAADNKIRDPNMDTLKVTIDREKNEVSVFNNGKGIPIEHHEKEGIWIPELIFGHLLTSSNYDDDEKKVVGGRNGYGAKLCNIFSTEFILETADKSTKQKYKQTWTNNMSKRGGAKITKNPKGEEYTKITFKPDLAKFGMTEMDEDLESIIKRRVYDMAGTIKQVKVFLNGTRISKIKNFKQYCEMYVKALREESEGDEKMEIIHAVVNDRWEIAFAVSNGSFQQVSFVNSIATTSGGTHVNHVADQLCTKLESHIKKRNKSGAPVKNAQIRNHFFLFVNCLIENPAFTSQTKEQLTTKQSSFGSKCPLPDDFVKKVVKTEVISNIVEFANMKADKQLKRADGGKRTRIHNANLTDANKAGTKQSHECVLILTEGLSASGLARAGIAAIKGHDRYGVFPLRGKVLNVRDASTDQISKNVEIAHLKQILGLQHKKVYENVKDLRYGHIMIMTDQDHDGSHIKGLLINFFDAQFPSLLKIPNFLIEFITPIVKIYKGDLKRPTKEKSFFTMPEYDQWKEQNTESGWKHKYYKGLGTSGDEDAKVYFADLDRHMKYFHTMCLDGKKLIELAFSKSKADERKEWLRSYQPGTFLDHTIDKISYPDFVNKELILFSVADCARSIPSVVDGLKPGQRKILFGAFKRNLKNEIKVVQLAGYVSEHTGYQHGEESLKSTITAMGQVFTGANNVNLLDPSGNFGSRLQGGKDAANARYIYTSLSAFARKVIPASDDRLLTYNFDDGNRIEPHWYVPVVPMILVNGTEGIGTGWSSSIPSYNPEDIVNNLRRLMDGKDLEPMTPWYRGWTGSIEKVSESKFKFTGTIRQLDELKVEVTELPIKMWTQTFKERLEEIIKGEKTPSFIKDYVDYNSPSKVHFVITMSSAEAMQKALAEGLENKFKLSNTVATTNLVAFDPEGRINRYGTIDDIMKEFYFIRMKYYQERKKVLLVDLGEELKKLSNQARFIQMVIRGQLVVGGKKRKEIVAQLKKHSFPLFSKKKDAELAGELEPTLDEPEEDDSSAAAKNDDDVGDGYNYLLGMAIWTLTEEKAQKLLNDVKDKEQEIDILTRKTPRDLWTNDLDEFIALWRHQLEEDERLAQGRPKLKKSKPRKKKGDDDSEDDYDATLAAKRKKAPPKKQSTLLFMPAEKAEKKPARAATKKPTIVHDDDALDDVFEMIEQAAPKKSQPKAKLKVEKPTKPKVMELDDDDLDMIGSAAQPCKDDNGDSFMTAEEVPTPKKPAAEIGSDGDSDFDILEPKGKKTVPKVIGNKTAGKAKAGIAKAALKSKPGVNDESSIFDFNEDDPAPKQRSKRTAVKKPILDDDSENDNLGDVSMLVKGVGDESVVSSRPLFAASSKGASKTAAAKKPVPKSTTKAFEFLDSDDEDSDELSKPPAKTKPKPLDLDSEDEDELPKPIVRKTAPKKLAPAKKTTLAKKPAPVKPATKARGKKIQDSDDDEMDIDKEVDQLLSDSEMEDAPVSKAPAKPKPAPKAAAKKPEPAVELSPPPRARAGRGRAAAAKPVVYKIVDSDEEEEDESEEDYGDEEDDD